MSSGTLPLSALRAYPERPFGPDPYRPFGPSAQLFLTNIKFHTDSRFSKIFPISIIECFTEIRTGIIKILIIDIFSFIIQLLSSVIPPIHIFTKPSSFTDLINHFIPIYVRGFSIWNPENVRLQ
ncbi:MAG: hypothetical protein [Circoviridae sp.]|nr:MAG: hypothetical protein [Circoviridae sp.]